MLLEMRSPIFSKTSLITAEVASAKPSSPPEQNDPPSEDFVLWLSTVVPKTRFPLIDPTALTLNSTVDSASELKNLGLYFTRGSNRSTRKTK